ncbi:hypothetical protein [Gimesia algae]|uniref:Uncharacterized protein n=1 Tax=Gimesia algae TaxID=2527971 RepID=A0A517VIP5_9PLAN|nr:hypothetical protein [Gimesia algae]QDT92876.1 hypothetical protein Pan161_45470 [Gimesia algae]
MINPESVSRRQFLSSMIATAGSAALAGLACADKAEFPPTRVITKGPRHHWFGYYDKLQFDPSSRYVLGMEVAFEHRSPKEDDVIKIGMVDLQDQDRWIELGESSAWNWQQGCMLQWLPGSKTKVIWNDREQGQFVSRILDVKTGEGRTVASPVYSVSPDGKTAITPDFSRVQDVRPGYGYPGFPDPHFKDLAPQDSGIFKVDLETGKRELILTLEEISRTGTIPNQQQDIKHYFNHLLFSPDGSRFITLHRWQYPNGKRLSRMVTANLDGSDVRVVVDNGFVSHFIWRDPQHILTQSKATPDSPSWGDFLVKDVSQGKLQQVGKGVLDNGGHLTYLPGNEWILNDTYPKGKSRIQTPHLYHVTSGKRIDLGHFHSPAIYTGEWRVDTHPRFSPDAKYVCIDSPHKNEGRQLHLIDISKIVGQS